MWRKHEKGRRRQKTETEEGAYLDEIELIEPQLNFARSREKLCRRVNLLQIMAVRGNHVRVSKIRSDCRFGRGLSDLVCSALEDHGFDGHESARPLPCTQYTQLVNRLVQATHTGIYVLQSSRLARPPNQRIYTVHSQQGHR